MTGDGLGDNREAAGIMIHLWIDSRLRQGVGIMAGTRATQVRAAMANGQILPYPAPVGSCRDARGEPGPLSHMDYLSVADRSWPILRRLMGIHAVVYRATGGHVGHRFPGAPPMLLLDHVGAKSRTRRTTPLVYVEDGDSVVVIASKGGHPRNPAWFHNLLTNPRTTIQIGSEHRKVRARVATPAERARLWPKAVEAYRGYEGYQQRTGREIPLVILEPRE